MIDIKYRNKLLKIKRTVKEKKTFKINRKTLSIFSKTSIRHMRKHAITSGIHWVIYNIKLKNNPAINT